MREAAAAAGVVQLLLAGRVGAGAVLLEDVRGGALAEVARSRDIEALRDAARHFARDLVTLEQIERCKRAIAAEGRLERRVAELERELDENRRPWWRRWASR